MSAKELGQIHTVNYYNVLDPSSSTSLIINYDIAGELCEQLQRMVRQGNFFKLVGIDLSLSTVGTLGGGQITGAIRYFAPTRGRCAAYRTAFDAMRTAMNLQGINMRDNEMYDFRAGFNGSGRLLADGATIINQASLDGQTPLNLVSYAGEPSIFGVHNQGVLPTADLVPAGDLFKAGFNTMGVQSTPTDFVLSDSQLWTGNADAASEEWEYIPFSMSWTPDTTDIATNYSFRPDPALYLAIMTGQLQVLIEEINVDGGADDLELAAAVQISGWKSIMGNPDKKKRSSRGKRSRRKSKQ